MKRLKERTSEALFFSATLFSMLVTVAIFGFMVVLGLPVLRDGGYLKLLFSMWDPGVGKFGILPMLHGTLWISCLSLLFAIPLSLGCSALICNLAKGIMARTLSVTVRMMTGIPTVIYGFTGVFLIIPFVRTWISGGSGFSIFSAALMLSLMVSPTLILFFSDSFHAAEKLHGKGADALGCSPVQKFLHVILPASVPGMITGIILAAGRAFGDTLIALMLAGNAVAIPESPFDPARTLTSHIALIIAADYESLEFKSIFACGITLYLLQSCLTAVIYGLRVYSQRRPR